MKIIAVLLLFVVVAFCANGVDVSSAVTVTAFSCLAKGGFTYAIVRCYRSSGSVDADCAPSVANARAAGFSDVDVYVFPCFQCGDGAGQINATVSYLHENNVKYSTMWLDIEGGSLYWGGVSANQAFFADMVSAGNKYGVKIGVYTSASQWSPIMGTSTAGSSFPLWYAHYDNVQSFDDFSAFGGWKTPAMKQYNGDQTVCGTGLDYNWSPGGSNNTNTITTAGGPTVSSGTTAGNSAGPDTGQTAGPATGQTAGSDTSKTAGSDTSKTAGSDTGKTDGGNSQTGQSTQAADTNSGTTGYSTGSSTSGSGSEFRLSPGSIYNTRLGGNKVRVVEHKAANAETKIKEKPEKPEKPKKNNKLNVEMAEVEDIDEKESHFRVAEEKLSRKFF